MQIQNYILNINNKAGNSQGYVELPHGEEYALVLENNNVERCEASVSIDGDHVGTWVLSPFQRASIERPVDVARKFTFLLSDSKEAKQLNKGTPNEYKGLVQVTFTPEQKPILRRKTRAIMRPQSGVRGQSVNSGYMACDFDGGDSLESRSAGETGLGEYSNQSFREVRGLNLDHNKAVIISLRLVGTNEEQYTWIDKENANPVPKPL